MDAASSLGRYVKTPEVSDEKGYHIEDAGYQVGADLDLAQILPVSMFRSLSVSCMSE